MESSKNNNSKRIRLHEVTGKIDDSFVGIKIKGNEIHLYHPELYELDLDSKDFRNDVIDLIRTISIAKTLSLETNLSYNSHVKDGEFALLSYLWLINDYMKNGFYINREKLFKVNQKGKVQWKKTFETQPIISNGNIIYRDIVVETKNRIDNIMVEIHKYCIKKSIDYIGWLFNLNSNMIVIEPFNDVRKKQYLNVIVSELNNTFDDMKKSRLVHMKNVITGLDDNTKDNDFVYGVDNYYYIYEKMIDSIYSNISNKSEFDPGANWHLIKNNYVPIPSSKLRPDTIFTKDNYLFVLDSKYYRYGYTEDSNDLPETTSIQKQITYGEYIKKKVSHLYDDVFNVFLLPYNKNKGSFRSNKNIQYIGYAKADWKDGLNSHEIIYSFLIDLKYVIKTWNRSNHNKDVDELVNWIIEISKQQPISI